MNNSKILNSTMGIFYREMKEHGTFKSLIDILSKADEFTSIITSDESKAKELDEVTDFLLNFKLAENIKLALDKKTSEKYERQKKVCWINIHMLVARQRSQSCYSGESFDVGACIFSKGNPF
jgi:hypothetical protein